MAVFVPVDYGAAKLPFLTIILLYADSLKYQHIVMLTFVKTLVRFSNLLLAAFSYYYSIIR